MVLIIGVMTSCNSILDENEYYTNDVNVKFTISMNNHLPSRAVMLGENLDTYENQMDLSQLNVYLLRGSSSWKVQDILAQRISDSVYEIIGSVTLPKSLAETQNTYKIMVFANSGSLININTVGTLSYNYDVSTFYPIQGTVYKYIPMWGVATRNVIMELGKRTDLGTINVLRALAKVEVSLDESVDFFALQSVKINNYNNKGYALPSTYASIDNLMENLTSDNINVPTGSLVNSTMDFFQIDAKHYIIYIPEFNNQGATQSSIKVTVKMTSTSETKEYTINFKDYSSSSNNTIWNICRNYDYKFNICGLNQDIKLYYTIDAWNTYNIDVPAFE